MNIHPGALAQTVKMLLSTSRPVSLQHTLQDALVQTRFLQNTYRPASLSRKDLSPTDHQTGFSLLHHRTYTGHLAGTAFPVWNRLQTVTYLTDHPLNFLLRMRSCQTTRRAIWIKIFQKIRLIEKLCGGYAHTWDGPMYRTLTVQTHLMVTPLPAQRLLHQARFQFKCRQRIGYVGNWPSSI